MNLTGKTILITGGTSGIGLELARRLLGMGNTVIVTGRDEQKIAAAKLVLPNLHTVRSDVSQPQEIASLHRYLMEHFPTLDVLVNNAGIMRNINLSVDSSLVDITDEIDIDLSGPIRMVQQFLAHFLTRPEAMIVNMTSGIAFVPFPSSPVYSAAKSGLRAYTRALRVQLKHSSVKVIEIAPPATDTGLFHGALPIKNDPKGLQPMPLGRLADHAIAGLLAGKTEIRPGLSQMLKWLSRVAPEFGLRQLAKASGY